MKFLLHCSSPTLSNMIAVNAAVDNTTKKPSVSLLALTTLVIAVTAAKIRAAAEAQVPEGYEDATGFHYSHPRRTRRRLQKNPSPVWNCFGLRHAFCPAQTRLDRECAPVPARI
jgi:hypothetical protein